MVTMLLGGLWHGANWTFVVWGGLHGLYLWVEKFFRDRRTVRLNGSEDAHSGSSGAGFLYALLTFMLVNITWVFFRSGTFAKAWQMLQSMFGLMPDGRPLLTSLALLKVLVVIPAMLIVQWFMRNKRVLHEVHHLSWWKVGIAWSTLILLLIWAQESGSSFIYFQF